MTQFQHTSLNGHPIISGQLLIQCPKSGSQQKIIIFLASLLIKKKSDLIQIDTISQIQNYTHRMRSY